MAGHDDGNADFVELLRPFHERATVAEARLAELEAAVHGVTGLSGQDGLLESLIELREKLQNAKAEQKVEREKLISEKRKLSYQVLHLQRALKEADGRLAQAQAS